MTADDLNAPLGQDNANAGAASRRPRSLPQMPGRSRLALFVGVFVPWAIFVDDPSRRRTDSRGPVDPVCGDDAASGGRTCRARRPGASDPAAPGPALRYVAPEASTTPPHRRRPTAPPKPPIKDHHHHRRQDRRAPGGEIRATPEPAPEMPSALNAPSAERAAAAAKRHPRPEIVRNDARKAPSPKLPPTACGPAEAYAQPVRALRASRTRRGSRSSSVGSASAPASPTTPSASCRRR